MPRARAFPNTKACFFVAFYKGLCVDRAIQEHHRLCPATQSVGRNEKPLRMSVTITLHTTIQWPVGLMDKASASGAGDSRFESWAGHIVQAQCSQARASNP